MEYKATTPAACSCPLAGFCDRHGIAKPAHWHKLCQAHDGYREAWDAGIGPGQRTPVAATPPVPTEAKPTKKGCGRKSGATKTLAMPSLARQAWNLAESLAAFVADGLHLVDAAEYERRLSICDTCELRQDTRCARCGCRLALKARGRAFRCPDGRWEQ